MPVAMVYLDQAGSGCPGDPCERVGLLRTAMNEPMATDGACGGVGARLLL